MNLPNLKLNPDYQIQQRGFQLLIKELGIVEFIQFIQLFDKGAGNYTEDRQHWQSEYTVDAIAQAIWRGDYLIK